MRRGAGVAFALIASLPLAAATAAGPAACPALRWTALGTAGGPVPTPERSEPANLLTAGDQSILVDAGDGTVNQIAALGMALGQVRTVFVSHLHLDHSAGLGAVIGLRWMNQFPGELTVYGPPGITEVVDGIIASMAPPGRIGFGLGVTPPPPAGSVRAIAIRDGARIPLGGLLVTAAANSHFDQAGAADPGGALSLSYRFQLGPRSITYTGDTGPSEAVTKLAAGSDMLVSEVIDLDRLLAEIRARRPDAGPDMFDQMRRHLGTHHLTADDIGGMAAKADVGHVVLTHFAVPPGPLAVSEPALRNGIRRRFAGPLDLAQDLSSYDVGCK